MQASGVRREERIQKAEAGGPGHSCGLLHHCTGAEPVIGDPDLEILIFTQHVHICQRTEFTKVLDSYLNNLPLCSEQKMFINLLSKSVNQDNST